MLTKESFKMADGTIIDYEVNRDLLNNLTGDEKAYLYEDLVRRLENGLDGYYFGELLIKVINVWYPEGNQYVN